MQVVLRTGAGEIDVEVAVHDPAATVADLASAVSRCGLMSDRGGGDALTIDGVPVPGPTPLAAAGLRPGCELATDLPAIELDPPKEHEAELVVVGGLAAGGRHPLQLGCSIVGRHHAGAVVLPGRTTSKRHARLDVETGGLVWVRDAGSTSGTWVDGRRIFGREPLEPAADVALGAAVVGVGAPAWCEPAVLGPPGPDGRRPLRRPPPASPPAPGAAVAPPSSEAAASDVPRFGWAAALVPLVAALVLARLVDPRLALFTLLGPAVLAGQWLEDRRRQRRRGADSAAARRTHLAAFLAQVEAASTAEAGRRRAVHRDPSAVGQEIERVGSQLWSRRPGHPSFAEVAVGAAPALAWSPPTIRPAEGQAGVVLAGARLPHGAPATLSLSAGSHLGISGPRSAALAVARWIALQLAFHHGPADLRIAVVCAAGRAEEWRWTTYLPHVASSSGGGRPLLAAGPVHVAELAAAWPSSGGRMTIVVIVDGEGLLEGGGPTVQLPPGAATLTVGPGRRSLPARCTSVLELDGSDGWGHLATGSDPSQAVLATGIERATARRWSRRLAGLSDPEAGGGPPAPAAARLVDLLGLDRPTPAAVRRRWAGAGGANTPLGCAGDMPSTGPVHVDLVADGPHMLVAGTTGSGKSELLRSLVAGLAASAPPDRLSLLLVDYKGGAAFAEAAALPHVVGVVTDLGPDEAARALHSLEAELRRREAVLAALGVRDLVDHPAHGRSPAPSELAPLPRLVVVVDELAALVAELPTFLDGLVQLAGRGRSLGLHLVLATQRPGSVVSAAVRTNCTIRCCLRVPDEADAVDVVGSRSPAHFDRRQPGRAVLRRGAGDLVELQVALAGGHRPADRAPVEVQPAGFGPQAAVPVRSAVSGPSDLALLVAACREAATDLGHASPPPLWLPPLPDALQASDLPPAERDVVFGLIDDPDRQRRLPLSWRPKDGPLVAVGSGAGPALALQAIARTEAARRTPHELHLYALDLAGQNLADLTELPHVGAVIHPGEQERLHRLLQRLSDELAARQAAAARGSSGAGWAPPLILVLIDGVSALRAALDGSAGLAALDAFERVVVDGAALGLVVALSADRPAAVAPAWAGAASRRLVFRCGDALDLLSLGARRVDQARWPDGRCLELGSNLVAQVATFGWLRPTAPTDVGGCPAQVAVLPTTVPLREVVAACAPRAADDGLHLPLGIEGQRLGIATVRLRPGQPFLVCGPAGSGRSTALAAITASAEMAGCPVVSAEGFGGRLAAEGARGAVPPLVLSIDDADRVADPDGHLAELAAGRHPGVHLVAAVPLDVVRSGFGHWTADLRRAGAGIVLRPRSELDADVLGAPLLPRWPVPLNAPGRGVLVVDGQPAPLQVAVP